MYFGFDREWTNETLQFLKHRLLSLVKAALSTTAVVSAGRQRAGEKETLHSHPSSALITPSSPLITPSSPLITPSSPLIRPSTFADPNYQTFGTLAFDSPCSPPRALLSPKSRNKFIIGSLINVLQLILKRIVLRRILHARPIRIAHLLQLQ